MVFWTTKKKAKAMQDIPTQCPLCDAGNDPTPHICGTVELPSNLVIASNIEDPNALRSHTVARIIEPNVFDKDLWEQQSLGSHLLGVVKIAHAPKARRRIHYMNAGEEQVLSTEKAIYEHIHEGRYSDLATFLGANGFRIHCLIDLPEWSRQNNIWGWAYTYNALSREETSIYDGRIAPNTFYVEMTYIYEDIIYETRQDYAIGNNAQIVSRPLTR